MNDRFPILKTNETIPMSIIKPHEQQAIKNHNQTLEQLSKRGGLDWIEAACVLKDVSYDYNMTITEAKDIVMKRIL